MPFFVSLQSRSASLLGVNAPEEDGSWIETAIQRNLKMVLLSLELKRAQTARIERMPTVLSKLSKGLVDLVGIEPTTSSMP